MTHPSTKCKGNQLGSFCLILPTSKQTNADKNTTSLALVAVQVIHVKSARNAKHTVYNPSHAPWDLPICAWFCKDFLKVPQFLKAFM